jgi:hypothetical protein
MNATNAVVENKMEPVGKSEPGSHLVVTGQYLYDNFMQSNESDRTRMTIIRELSQSADVHQIKGAADKMVERAREVDLAGGLPEKEKVVIGGVEKERRTRGPKEASAMNVRTIIQTVWGALKNAPDEVAALGMTPDTGYFAAKAIADKALKAKRINWKGEAEKTDADRQRARMAREQKAETDAKLGALKNLPRLPDESDIDHYQRVLKAAATSIDEARKSAEKKLVDKLVSDLMAKHGEGIALAVAETIALQLGVNITVDADETPASEVTEDEARAMLEAHARAEEAAQQHSDEEQPA